MRIFRSVGRASGELKEPGIAVLFGVNMVLVGSVNRGKTPGRCERALRKGKLGQTGTD